MDKNIDKDNQKKSIKQLQKDIFDKSRKYELDKLKTYKTVPISKLAKSVSSLNTIFGSLTAKESITIKQDNQSIEPSYNSELSLKIFEEEITENTFTTQTPMILKIRKPDYLGESQWEFRHGGKTIKAQISDTEWLQDFQNAKIIAKPQDSLDCIVNIETKYDNNNELIDDCHEITKVNKVIAQDSSIQTSFNIQ